jgi:hypothetical protein
MKYFLKEQFTGHAKTIKNIGCSKPQHSSTGIRQAFSRKDDAKNLLLKTSESAFPGHFRIIKKSLEC